MRSLSPTAAADLVLLGWFPIGALRIHRLLPKGPLGRPPPFRVQRLSRIKCKNKCKKNTLVSPCNSLVIHWEGLKLKCRLRPLAVGRSRLTRLARHSLLKLRMPRTHLPV